jgi:hypothetical protein
MKTTYERRRVFEAIPVTDLPLPHNPYQCEYHDRFNTLTGHYSLAEGARQFIASLTRDEVKACWYHKENWAAIADESARIVEVVGPLQPAGYYIQEARQSNLGSGDLSWGGDLRWLLSLFESPIIISGGAYTDGQHRGCALRFSGAELAAVVTRYENVALASRRNY